MPVLHDCGQLISKDHEEYEKRDGTSGSMIRLVFSVPEGRKGGEVEHSELMVQAWNQRADELEAELVEGDWYKFRCFVQSRKPKDYWNTDLNLADIQPVG